MWASCLHHWASSSCCLWRRWRFFSGGVNVGHLVAHIFGFVFIGWFIFFLRLSTCSMRKSPMWEEYVCDITYFPSLKNKLKQFINQQIRKRYCPQISELDAPQLISRVFLKLIPLGCLVWWKILTPNRGLLDLELADAQRSSLASETMRKALKMSLITSSGLGKTTRNQWCNLRLYLTIPVLSSSLQIHSASEFSPRISRRHGHSSRHWWSQNDFWGHRKNNMTHCRTTEEAIPRMAMAEATLRTRMDQVKALGWSRHWPGCFPVSYAAVVTTLTILVRIKYHWHRCGEACAEAHISHLSKDWCKLH